MTINLFDDASWTSLRPLTFTRPVADLRVGILTIAEKWGSYLNADFGFCTQDYLSVKFAPKPNAGLFINGSVCPDEALLNAVSNLKTGEALYKKEVVIAYIADQHNLKAVKTLKPIEYSGDIVQIVYPENIFGHNPAEIRKDFKLLTQGRTSASISSTNQLLGDDIFLEEGAKVECSVLNSGYGPIYIGKNAEIWEGSLIRGSFALCENSSVKMGAKIYSGTTIGPNSRAGGEINNAVIWGNSAKGHEGYLGNSVMGEWCNIGADTNNSNLKNNYAEVKLYDYESEKMRNTTLQFCGLIMADHAKSGINTMFNTGSVVGVGANVFGGGFPPHHIADFSWGGAAGFDTYKLHKMFETTEKVFARKDVAFNEVEKNILTKVFELTESYRRF
ncbi:putative sugar nucleotidyl transferase [Pedobacter zeae]|uniref:Glucose-1-phosphate thymidylyltransferase n=1 Tax=Pedobacter zeae TaxID=1737356 RepID=A0A7W6K7G1_9SPHI|nr:putative sugar nucleotidyl transferase [Pedobacter zeae]MBB4106540.1 UDP-N-acetylglucosamine diphosphorylase/glucosamine-1-phosphate N-acetyltransferase [Pedobacter zeae]GGH02308.1 glucose-1-phosphate thymidylyltransferase [Pedobacter zeae]